MASSGTITNCENHDSINGGGNTGGIIGQINYSDTPVSLTGNINTGTVNGEPASDANAIGYDGRNQQ